MTTLSQSSSRAYELGDKNDLPVVAGDIIYEGAAVGASSGYARPLVAADDFHGFALADVDNSTGSSGEKYVHLQHKGRVELPITGLAITDIGAKIYASDDDTFTKTSTSNSYIGRVVRFVSSGVGIIEFDAGQGAVA